MDRGSKHSLGGPEETSRISTNTHGPRRRREPTTIHHRNNSRRQHRHRRRAPSRRTHVPSAITSLLLYAILMTSRKLRHYFESYRVSVVTEFPLADILHNPEATGRIAKWPIELGALHMDFKPRTTIKSQALVISWQNGGKIKSQHCLTRRSIGQCTSMVP